MQSQKGVGLLVGVQERRALFVPLVNRWFCSSAGLHEYSFVRACTGICRGIPSMQKRRCTSLHPVRIRASGETFRRRVFDALEGARKDCPLGEQFCWHTVLPDPASPPRRAPRRDPPVVCPGFGLSRFRKRGQSYLHVIPIEKQHPRMTTRRPPGNHWLTTGLLAGREALSVPGC